MAKRKKSRKSGSRRRRISGVGGSGLQLVLGTALGAVGTQVLTTQMAQNMPGVKPNIIALAQLGIGGVTAAKVKNPFIVGIGLGMAGVGALNTARSFGVISGVGNIGASNLVTFQASPSLNGMENVIAATGDDYDELSVIAGTSIM